MIRSRQVREAVGLLAGGTELVVDIAVEGRAFVCVLKLDRDEHQRRVDVGIGALTSRGPLHALWNLSSDTPVMSDSLHPRDVETLRLLPDVYVERVASALRRIYEPPGSVSLMGLVGRKLDRLVLRAQGIVPIVRRLAIWLEPSHPTPIPGDVELRLSQAGLGLIRIDGAGTPTIVHRPAQGQLGVPAVYPWWLAEKAYEAWLYAQRAQADN